MITPEYVGKFMDGFVTLKTKPQEKGLEALIGAEFGICEHGVEIHEYKLEGASTRTAIVTVCMDDIGQAKNIAELLAKATSECDGTFIFRNVRIDVWGHMFMQEGVATTRHEASRP